MTKLSHIIDTDAVYQAALRQLAADRDWQWTDDERATRAERRIAETEAFAAWTAPAPPTGPR